VVPLLSPLNPRQLLHNARIFEFPQRAEELKSFIDWDATGDQQEDFFLAL